MTDLLTSAQMRAVERGVIESGAVHGLALMERAGQGVVTAIFARFAVFVNSPGRAVVLCGPGNNGGDGYVIARLLHHRGWAVEVRAYGDLERMPPDARAMRAQWLALGPVRALSAPGEGGFAGNVPDLIVDALFGTGLTRALPDDVTRVLSALNAWGKTLPGFPPVVAVDVPSGLCADSGRARGAVLRADLTVTFHTAKPGHYLAEGPQLCGALEVVDIGLPARGGFAQTPRDVVRLIGVPRMLRKRAGHKYDHGHALILSGPMGRSGAARLAARGALRVGAGVVTVAAPGSSLMECAAQLTAIMLRRCDGPEALAALLDDARINALCLGPGLGIARARDLLPVVLERTAQGLSLVLDADALSALAPLDRGLSSTCVLTPHMGEFARLFPDLAERLGPPPQRGPAFSRLDAAREAAARAGCVVLLKGADTVIAAPNGFGAVHGAVYERATPWLATAGAGDVLAGMIAGLMARGQSPLEAACAAVWLHVEAARAFGPGLIAEDLPEAVPAVLCDLLRAR